MTFLKGFLTSTILKSNTILPTSTRITIPSSFSSSSSNSNRNPFSKTIGGVAAFSLFGFTFGGTSKSNPNAAGASNSDSSFSSSQSQSSSLLREKSPAAFRKQPTTLVFVSTGNVSQDQLRETRDKWYNWIAYFREAGFDCLDVNLNVSDSVKSNCDSVEKESKILGEELSSQIALASLQRQPLIFIRSSSSQIVQSLFDSSSRTHSQPSGIVLLSSSSSNESQDLSIKVSGFPKKLLVALVSFESSEKVLGENGNKNVQHVKSEKDVDGDKAMREIERWMTRNGFA